MSVTAQLVFDKTSKGQEEIATRKHGLPSRLRSLLVLVDGKTTVEGLVKKVAGLGLNEESIAELLEQEYIAPHEGAASVQAPPPPAQAKSPAPAPVAPAPEASPTTTVLPEGETQFEALYHFYTTTIKSTLGLRGFAMQMKVERCANIDDFRALRQTYIEAVQKSKGDEMARSLGARLDQLLSLG
ncbi:MAG TPA: hypothetical protein VF472_10105 [Burkholderiaceae bacterium]